ncbi:flippase [Thermophilibacter immobilis]|uniref:Flippase n=1 Tax=Thermophilibacter immobilis TaxID=2779519 RepID=A0A7S7RU88_9ACTN|nr:flippase [Thermophilibacter immobilis]QOY60348.1 flippase [Thermophilibacter immobilis]
MGGRSLRKNFLLNSAYQILQAVTPLLTTPYLARVLGPDQNGVFSYTQSITNYFVLFATLGMSIYGVRTIALCGEDRKKRSQTFCEIYASQLGVGLVVMLVYILYAATIHKGGTVIAALWGLWVLYAATDVSWLLFGCEEFKIPTIRSFATKIIMIVTVFFFVHDENDLWVYVMAVSGSYFLNAASLWPFMKNYIDFAKPKPSEVWKHLKASARLFVPVIAVSIYTTLDKIMLGSLSSSDQVAFFDYSEKISRLPLNVVTALGTVMLPRMSQTLQYGDRKEGLSLLKTAVWIMLATAIALAAGIAAVAPVFVPVFFGKGYEACIGLMRVLVVIIPVISMTNVIGKQYLLPSSRDGEYTLSLVIGAIVNVVFNLITIPLLGAMGAAIGTVLAELSILVTQSIMVREELPLLSYFKGAIPFLCIGIIMSAAIRVFAPRMLRARGISLLTLLAEVVVGAIVYLGISIVWCLATKDVQFRRLFGKYLPRKTRS